MTSLSEGVAEAVKLFGQIQSYKCLEVRGDYSQSKIQTLKSYYIVDYNRNVDSHLHGQ